MPWRCAACILALRFRLPAACGNPRTHATAPLVPAPQGFGWAIAKCLAEAGAEISLGVWVPALNIFETSFRRGKFDESRRLSNGSLMEFAHIYPMDAVFDTMDDVPADVRRGKGEQAAGWCSPTMLAGAAQRCVMAERRGHGKMAPFSSLPMPDTGLCTPAAQLWPRGSAPACRMAAGEG